MKAFKIKNGLQASRYLLSSTTISGSTIDLSLGSMFSTTLSSDPAYTFTNPPASGVAQAFSLEVAGGTTTFNNDSTFSTDLYTGTYYNEDGDKTTVNNGINLSSDGGLVWLKSRSNTRRHMLFDTERGASVSLSSNTTGGNLTSDPLDSFTSTGFITGDNYETNEQGETYVSWTFKKQAKFFDIVTYTGTGVARNISHSLGSVPGMILVKRTNAAASWRVYHRGMDATSPQNYFMGINLTTGLQASSIQWNDTAPTDTAFTVGTSGNVNGSGNEFIAYIFAHDTASDSRIKCGSYVGNGSTAGPEINLGWSPQWVMIKRTDTDIADSWIIHDTVRGIVSGGADPYLLASSSAAENSISVIDVTSTGFKLTAGYGGWDGSGGNYIYMAIRGNATTDSAITWPTSIKWPAGVAPTTPVPGKKDLFTFLTTDGGTTYYGKKAAEGIA